MKALILVSALLLFGGTSAAQERCPGARWDIAIWVSAATGEEHTNSFLEAQTWSAGVFFGHAITDEVGRGWWRGQLEYGFDLVPFFAQSRPQALYGGGFTPVVLRWNTGLRFRGARPYIELAGGALRTTTNLPSGDTSSFNFTATGGGGLYLPVGERKCIDMALRWSHISNANLGRRNPEFNGIELRIAYRWRR